MVFVAGLALAGCGRDVRVFARKPFPEKLSAWRLFVSEAGGWKPNRRVVAYELTNPLFTDYATKRRFVWMPPGKAAVYKAEETFEFPKGTVIAKTFSYPDVSVKGGERRIETRLLVNGDEGWVALPYVWNGEQTEATLQVVADPVDVRWRAGDGKERTIHYAIPNANQCKECHDANKATRPIGPKARHLNRDIETPEGRRNQLAYWTSIGYLRGAPFDPEKAPRQAVWDDAATGTLEARARAYLDINCGHCHSEGGAASNTGLYLNDLEKDRARIGFCKTPVATGKGSADMLFDEVPGHPERSILVHRMGSEEPKVMMPEIGRTIVHDEGVELIREWVGSLRGDCGATRPSI